MNDAEAIRTARAQVRRQSTRVAPDPVTVAMGKLKLDGVYSPDVDRPLTDPRDLPELRRNLLARWRPGAAYHERAGLMNLVVPGPNGTTHSAPMGRRFDPLALSRAALWWATPDMTDLIDHAAATLPPTTLTVDLLPDRWGLIAFARPLAGLDSDTGGSIETQVMVWGTTHVTPRDFRLNDGTDLALLTEDGADLWPDPLDPDTRRREPAITISCYGRRGADEPWCPQGRTDWFLGADTELSTDAFHDETHTASMAEDRRRLAALWLLSGQPLADTSARAHAPRATRRRVERARPRPPDAGLVDAEVRLIDVRAPHRPPAPPSGEGRVINWSHRWMVGEDTGGYWRQQACGPGWKDHKPVWIMPFIKGPKDKPLRLAERVKFVRSAPDDRGGS